MRVYEDAIQIIIIRAETVPGEKLAVIGQSYHEMREVMWPAIRQHLRQLVSIRCISDSDMSATFMNGSVIFCYSEDRPGQLRGRYFSGAMVMERIAEREIMKLIDAGVIPPRYAPPPRPEFGL